MIELRSISLTSLSEKEWQMYCDASSEILRLYYPEQIRKKKSWLEFKKEYLDRVEENKENHYNEDVIFENQTVAGWVDYWIDPELSRIGFNFLYHKIPENILRMILNCIFNKLCEHKINFAYFATSDPRRIDVLKQINAEITEEFESSKLDRIDMNREMYDNIINNINLPDKFNLHLYNDFPEHLMDKLTEFENSAIEDINELKPSELKISPKKKADIIRQNLYNKNNGIGYYYYVLSDENENIIAVCSVLADPEKPDIITHIGGTAVNRLYRGNGYGKFLKAKMYKLLLKENSDFKYIITDTMPWNTYMYNINKEFGFKPYRNGCAFKISREFLENYLKIK